MIVKRTVREGGSERHDYSSEPGTYSQLFDQIQSGEFLSGTGNRQIRMMSVWKEVPKGCLSLTIVWDHLPPVSKVKEKRKHKCFSRST